MYYFLFIILKNISALLLHFKGFKRHFAALWICELENWWFRFFDVTNRLLNNDMFSKLLTYRKHLQATCSCVLMSFRLWNFRYSKKIILWIQWTTDHQKVTKCDFQNEFSLSRNIRIKKKAIENNSLGAHFVLKLFFDNFNFWHTLFSKIMSIFHLFIFGQNSCILGPTIFEIPQSKWHGRSYIKKLISIKTLHPPTFILFYGN